MIRTIKNGPRVYVTAVNAKNRKRSKSLTVYGLKPEQVMRILVNALKAVA